MTERFVPSSSAPEAGPPRLPWRRLIQPRGWPLLLVLGLGRLAAFLPLSAMPAAARPLAFVLRRVKRLRHVTERNLAVCRQDLTEEERATLQRASTREMAASVLTAFKVWFTFRPDHPGFTRSISYEGLGHLDAALAAGRPIILLNAHLNSTELNLAFTSLIPRAGRPLMAVYRAPSNALADAILQWGRGCASDRTLPSTQTRSIARHIKEGALMWFAPDLEFHGRGHVWAPFFGVSAATSNSVARFAALTGAVVLPMALRRGENGRGFVLRILPPLDGFPTGDAPADARRVNAALEEIIATAPTEYWWGLERFLNRPPGAPDIY